MYVGDPVDLRAGDDRDVAVVVKGESRGLPLLDVGPFEGPGWAVWARGGGQGEVGAALEEAEDGLLAARVAVVVLFRRG